MKAEIWKNNSIQFPRLLAEIRAVGLTPNQLTEIGNSMDVDVAHLNELMERAEVEWERIKERAANPVMTPEAIAFAHSLIETEDILDDLVHDAVSQDGSNTNNEGLEAQVEFLLENGYTLKQLQERIAQG